MHTGSLINSFEYLAEIAFPNFMRRFVKVILNLFIFLASVIIRLLNSNPAEHSILILIFSFIDIKPIEIKKVHLSAGITHYI